MSSKNHSLFCFFNRLKTIIGLVDGTGPDEESEWIEVENRAATAATKQHRHRSSSLGFKNVFVGSSRLVLLEVHVVFSTCCKTSLLICVLQMLRSITNKGGCFLSFFFHYSRREDKRAATLSTGQRSIFRPVACQCRPRSSEI